MPPRKQLTSIAGLPVNPTPEELQRVLTFGPLLAPKPQPPPSALAHMSSYICASEIFGSPIPAKELREYIRKFGWRPTLLRLATLAGALANDGGPESQVARRMTVDAILAQRKSVNWRWGLIADYVAANLHRPIAQEQVIYFLQALAILEGAEEGPAPGDLTLSFLPAGRERPSVWLARTGCPSADRA